MRSETVTFSGNTFTLNDAAKIETSNFIIQSGGRLIIPESLEVTGNLVAAQDSMVMIGFRPLPLPKPPGLEVGLQEIGFRPPPLPNPPGLEVGLHDLTDYFQSEDAVTLYSKFCDRPLDETRSYFYGFMTTDHKVYEVIDGLLSATKSFGTTGKDLVAFGFRIPPPPKPRGIDPALIVKSVVFQSGSRLNFNFDKGYTPANGDMISLANVPIQFDEKVLTNLEPGWVITNSVATAQYVGFLYPNL